jgi:hypothetical protein
MNHVRFMIRPELQVVQDKVQGFALYPTWCRGEGKKGDTWKKKRILKRSVLEKE